jgi:hypothetical protein
MKSDVVKIVLFFAVLVAIVCLVSGEPTSPCMKTVGACSVYTGV